MTYFKKYIYVLVTVSLLSADFVLADGQPRYIQERDVKVRFYYDSEFLSDHYSSYRYLYSDLFNSLRWVGRYRLGVNFVRDNSDYEREVDMSARQIWSWDQLRDLMDEYTPSTPDVISILLHARGMTRDGVCTDDLNLPPGSGYSFDQGLTWPDHSSSITPKAYLTVTARNGCSQNDFRLRPQSQVKDTFIHEISHALGHSGSGGSTTRCSTPPNASITCHGVSRGAIRNWQTWFTTDINIARNYLLGGSASDRIVECYEYSSYSSCQNQCANSAGYPDPGADDVFQRCVRQYCENICL